MSFWIAAFAMAHQDRAALRFQMQRDAENLALVFEQNVAQTTSDLDRELLFLRWARGHAPAGADWPAIVAQNFVANPETAEASLVGANGFMVMSSSQPYPLRVSRRPGIFSGAA